MCEETNQSVETSLWPDHFPSDCPPENAKDVQHEIYYLVAHVPPQADDFLSALQKGFFQDSDPCQRASLSCGLSRKYIEALRASIRRLRSHRVAKASLCPHHGKIKETGHPGHHSLWLRSDALRQALEIFEVLS